MVVSLVTHCGEVEEKNGYDLDRWQNERLDGESALVAMAVDITKEAA